MDTLVARLLSAVDARKGDLVFHLDEGERRIPPDELWDMASIRAQTLIDRGIGSGDAVGLLGPNRPDWTAWAFATWTVGATLVPLPFPLGLRDRDALSRQLTTFADLGKCKLVACHPRFARLLGSNTIRTWDDPLPVHSADLREAHPGPEDVAVIQFTSGSTGSPKGVVLDHRTIIAALTGTIEAIDATSDDIYIVWGPLFHDLGLFGYFVGPLLSLSDAHILPTERFARDPGEWFRTITRASGTITTGPTAGWAVALKALGRDASGIDLSTLRSGRWSAEAIDPHVVDRVRDEGTRVGLDPRSIVASYGMAEVTFMATVTRGPMTFDTISLAEMATGRAVPATTGLARRVASCGLPIRDMELRITDERDNPLDERRIGEIRLRSPGTFRGYLGVDAEETFIDGWFPTGDLGYFADAELHVTGRVKDTIIVMGQNFAPDDIEWAAARVPGVRPGRVIAFGRPDAEGHVVIALEPRNDADPGQLPALVKRSVATAVGISPSEVLVLPVGAIPKTTSGKLRRSALRDSYVRGELNLLA